MRESEVGRYLSRRGKLSSFGALVRTREQEYHGKAHPEFANRTKRDKNFEGSRREGMRKR